MSERNLRFVSGENGEGLTQYWKIRDALSSQLSSVRNRRYTNGAYIYTQAKFKYNEMGREKAKSSSLILFV